MVHWTWHMSCLTIQTVSKDYIHESHVNTYTEKKVYSTRGLNTNAPKSSVPKDKICSHGTQIMGVMSAEESAHSLHFIQFQL